LLPHDAIDQPVRFEEHMPVFLVAQAAQLLGARSASRRCGNAIGNIENPAQDVLGTLRKVVPRNVGDDVFQVALSVFGEDDLKESQSSATVLALNRLATSASGFTLPCPTCWLPSASIFINASVSSVCS